MMFNGEWWLVGWLNIVHCFEIKRQQNEEQKTAVVGLDYLDNDCFLRKKYEL